MKKQKKKQEKLILKMLPKEVVAKLNEGINTSEEFESATLFFSSVVGFSDVTRICTAMDVIYFLNELYRTMDDRIDNHDVYKVETISDSYLVASGLPIRNGDRYGYFFWKVIDIRINFGKTRYRYTLQGSSPQ